MISFDWVLRNENVTWTMQNVFVVVLPLKYLPNLIIYMPSLIYQNVSFYSVDIIFTTF